MDAAVKEIAGRSDWQGEIGCIALKSTASKKASSRESEVHCEHAN